MRSNASEPLDDQAYSRPGGNGLAVDTRSGSLFRNGPYTGDGRADIDAGFLHKSPRARPNQLAAAQRGSSIASSVYARGTAELNPVIAWGQMASGQREYESPPSHGNRGARHYERSHDGAASPQRSAVGDLYTTPTAHRASISTVMSGGPHSPAERTPSRQRNTGTPGSRRYSQAENDTYNGRSIASTYGLESQFSRLNFDDPNMYAHTPGRDSELAAMHVMGRNPVQMSASARMRSTSGAQNILTPETPSGAVFGGRARNHSRVNSMVSPNTRARAIEDTRNALTGSGRAGRGQPAAHSGEDHGQRMHAAQTWYGGGHDAGNARDTVSDTFAWGTPGAGRARTGSMALSVTPGRQHEQQMRGNGLAIDTRHRHRASYTGSGHGSHTPSAVGSSQYRGGRHTIGSRPADANSSIMSASARKSRHQSLQVKKGQTPIRSNRYYKEEALSDSDLKGQDFLSSDEEDFGSKEQGYGGDMVSQQRLIQKQQREIFDLNMEYKMLAKAVKDNPDQPIAAMSADYARTCASNRRANREIELLRNEVQALKSQCAALEDESTSRMRGVSEEDQMRMELQQREIEDLREKLARETELTKKRRRQLEDQDVRFRELEEQLARSQIDSDHWHREAAKLKHNTAMSASTSPVSPRARAGTTVTSETMTLRTPSEASGFPQTNLEHQLRESEQQRQQQADELQLVRKKVCEQDDELKQTRKRMREYEEQRRVLQIEMKHNQASHLALDSKSDRAEITRLTRETESLKDECDALQRQLSDARAQAQSHAEATLAAASAVDLDAAEDVYGSAAQRAEISSLRIECRDLDKRARMYEDYARDLAEKLETERGKMRALCHDNLRPIMREMTVGPTQAEAVYNNLRGWSQLKVVVPADPDTTPTKRSSSHPE
ncbi:hypothetical protein IWW50_003597 [Coemansia erecta]|nr:hypothetical protein GGF43_000726 [Coemansia sp. RSA 2618]KAJ2823872.1 hypothetical protein IWW50_003597 [Coemansia erecta]